MIEGGHQPKPSSGNSAQTSDLATQVDVQDPLPESDWFWRRAYTYALSLLTLALIWYGVHTLAGLGEGVSLYEITVRLIYLLAAIITFYMVAPSAEQITRMIQAARIIKAGGSVSRTATAETATGKTTVTTTAGAAEAAEPPETVEEEDAAPRSRT